MTKIKFLDIGAANYETAPRWCFLRHRIVPVLFEPDERSFSALKSKGYEVYNYALGEIEEVKKLNLTRKPECSSFYLPNMEVLNRYPQKERWDVIDSIDVNVRTLDSFSLDADFIKLDTQGSELDVLKGSSKTLTNNLGIEVEVSFIEIYKRQPLFGEVSSYLMAAGYEFFDFTTEYRYGRQSLDRRGQLSFADALFLKTPEKVKDMPKEKIEKYTTIVKAFGKEDLALCLTSLC